MRIYLAGPMTGVPEFNFPAFDDAAVRLRFFGHTVFNPAERDREEGFDPKKDVAGSMSYYMAHDLPEVCKADAVALLPGWENSRGATLEVEVAMRLGKTIQEWGVFLSTSPVGDYTQAGKAVRDILNRQQPKVGCYVKHPDLVTWIEPSGEQIRSAGGHKGGTPCPPPLTIDESLKQALTEKCPNLRFEWQRRGKPLPPESTNPKDLLGLKKVPLRLVPPALSIYVAKVMGLGAKKFGPFNWRTKKVRRTIYLEAAMRHILQALDGADKDPESGMPHEAHAAACMGILLDALATGNLIEDRPPAGAAEKLISELVEKD